MSQTFARVIALLELGNPAVLNLVVYAVLADDDTTTVTLINKEHGAGARPRSRSRATGRKPGSFRRWNGAWQSLPAPAADGSRQIHISVARAAVIRLAR